MKAVVIYSGNNSKLSEVPLRPLSKSEVLIRVAYVYICSTDIEIFKGELGYYKKKIAKYPIIPGHEYSGVVEKVGSEVRTIREGDKVVGECSIGCGSCNNCINGKEFICKDRLETGVLNKNGAYAEYVTIDERYIHKLSEDFNLKDAALIEPISVVLKALRKINPSSNDEILITGAGPIGNMCSQILLLKELSIDVLDKDENRLKLLVEGVNGKTQVNFKDYDYIIEASGDSPLLEEILVNSRGDVKILLMGIYGSTININMDEIVCYDKTVLGSVSSQSQDWNNAIELISNKDIDLSQFKKKTLPLPEYLEALRIHETKKYLKVLLEVNSVD